MRTSLGIASLGLLDHGANPALHIVSIGMLREDGDESITGGYLGDILPSKINKREKQIREEDEIAAMIAMAFIEIIK